MNADVGFRQDEDAGNAAAIAELVKVGMQDGRAGGEGRLPQGGLDCFGVGQVTGTPEVQKQVAPGVSDAVSFDEVVRTDAGAGSVSRRRRRGELEILGQKNPLPAVVDPRKSANLSEIRR